MANDKKKVPSNPSNQSSSQSDSRSNQNLSNQSNRAVEHDKKKALTNNVKNGMLVIKTVRYLNPKTFRRMKLLLKIQKKIEFKER